MTKSLPNHSNYKEIQMTETIISKKAFKSQDIETELNKHLTLARVETNFEKLPIWSTKPKRGTTFVPSKTIELEPEKLPDGSTIQRKIEIVPTQKFGYPTVQTQEYWYALQKLWHESPSKETGRIDFSRREIIEEILGKANGSNPRKALELSIEQLAATHFQFNYVFYEKEKDEIIKEVRGLNIITDYSFTSKETKNEIVHDKCSVTLHPLIVSNLRSGYFKPVLLSVISQLKSDIARLLYRKLDLQFSHYSKYEISTERFFREHALGGSEYKYPSARKRLLEKAVKELLGKPTSSSAVITSYKIVKTASGKDYKLIVHSSRAKKQALESIPIGVKVSDETTKESTKNSSVSSKTKVEVQQEKAPKEVNESRALLDCFKEQCLEPDAVYKPNKKAIEKAEEIVATYSLTIAKSFVRYAAEEAKKTKYKPKTFQGIIKYVDEAIANFKRQKNIDAIHRKQLEKKKLEDARYDHLKLHEPAYLHYLESIFEIFTFRYPKAILEFEKKEQEKKQELEKALEEAPRKGIKLRRKCLETFQRPGGKMCRFAEYFEGHDTVKVPDFWQWDKEVNPQRFSYE